MSAALQVVKQFRIGQLKEAPRTAKIPNPFLPRKNPDTGRWAPPRYSLRQQADLVKHARASGLVHLLPPGPKLSPRELQSAVTAASTSVSAVRTSETTSAAETVEPESENKAVGKWWTAEVDWQGEFKEKEVKGADVGNRLYAGKRRMFKGHKWERTLEKRALERKMLMKDMEARIERFRTTYKRKTPSPISPARPVSYSKLPF